MKRLCILPILAALLFPVAALAQTYPEGDWYDGAVLSSPAADSVAVDTDAMVTPTGNGQMLTFQVICTTTSTSSVIATVQIRDATNATTVRAHSIAIPAGGTEVFDARYAFLLLEGSRIRVVLPSAVVGQVECSLFTGRWQLM